jgi:predicted GNAT family acetyltransferase
MDVSLTSDVEEYAAAVEAFLLGDPVLNNVALTVLAQLRAGVPFGNGRPAFAVVRDGDIVVGAASRTPPHPLLLASMCTDAIDALAEAWPADDTPGVTGIADTSAIFAARWAARTGRSARRTMVLRIYRLSAVTPPSEVPGSLRPASMDDADLVTAWAVAFGSDTGATLGDVRPGIVHRIAARHVFLWELSGRPVALTVHGPAVGGIVRISLVYTPPELRRRGYATACVADVSRLALDDGARGCMLYADLANATSNAIYQRLGYWPVCDAADYHFDG